MTQYLTHPDSPQNYRKLGQKIRECYLNDPRDELNVSCGRCYLFIDEISFIRYYCLPRLCPIINNWISHWRLAVNDISSCNVHYPQFEIWILDLTISNALDFKSMRHVHDNSQVTFMNLRNRPLIWKFISASGSFALFTNRTGISLAEPQPTRASTKSVSHRTKIFPELVNCRSGSF